MMINNSKEQLMKAYQAYSFALYDTLLYLDAYPNDKCALDSYNKLQKMALKAKAEYEAKYGCISIPSEASAWQWVDAPWPWQISEEGSQRRGCCL